MSRLKAWWGQPDHYEWITVFLGQRGMLRPARMILAVVAGSSALVPLTVLPSQSRPSAGEVITGGVAAAFTVGVTVLWLTRWPTLRQSHRPRPKIAHRLSPALRPLLRTVSPQKKQSIPGRGANRGLRRVWRQEPGKTSLETRVWRQETGRP